MSDVALLVEQLRDEDLGRRAAAAEQLGQMGDAARGRRSPW